MKPLPEKPIQFVLQKTSSALSELLTHNKKIQTLNESIKQLLSPPLNEHVSVISYDKGKLTLSVSSASWHHQLRYQTTDLLENLRKQGLHNLMSIQIKIEFKIDTTRAGNRNPTQDIQFKQLSKNESEILNVLADSISDETLREAIKKLAENCKTT